MGTLDNKAALVTGAGQGIGQGIAYALAGSGAAIAVVGRTPEKLESTVAEIRKRGGTAVAITADVADEAQMKDAIDRTVDAFGGLDIVVNNAQEFNFGALLDIDAHTVDAGWRSGPVATLHTMRLAHPHLRGGGCVINISSGAVLDPGGVGAYAAAKAAIDSISRAAAVEWAADGIRVNTIMPFARTPATQAVFDSHPGFEEQLTERVPLGRVGDPEHDIGQAAAFLAGSDASYITGTTLVVDGGMNYVR